MRRHDLGDGEVGPAARIGTARTDEHHATWSVGRQGLHGTGGGRDEPDAHRFGHDAYGAYLSTQVRAEQRFETSELRRMCGDHEDIGQPSCWHVWNLFMNRRASVEARSGATMA
jgi:hypothetical protein